jgi:hypothetical protein
MRDFWRFHFLKVILGLVVIQFGVLAWLQYRNHRPVAQIDEARVFERQTVKIRPLTNDSDKDDDEITLHSVSEPQHGIIIREKNMLHYSAVNGFAGVDSFAYVVTDGKRESKEAFIKVTVNENKKPIAKKDESQLYAGGETVLNVLGNDKDKEGDSIFIHEYTSPIFGEVKQKGDKFIYISDGTVAQDSFQYVIGDGLKFSEKATVYIDIKNKNSPVYPWLAEDIGNAKISGSIESKGKKFIVKGTGVDVWGNFDGMHYAFRHKNGDCEIYAKIESMENTKPWAKAGVMIRESKSGNSKNVFMALTPENGLSFQFREKTGNRTNSIGGNEAIKAPCWIKLVRSGDIFTGYISQNGKIWTKATDSKSVPMEENVYIGFAVCSHDNAKLCKTIFSNYSISGKPTKLMFAKN